MTNIKRDWGQFALLLIDVQRDFWSEHTAQSFAHFPTNIARLLTLCRAEGIEIIHLRAVFKPDMSDWMLRYKLRGHIPCVQGTAGVETLPFALDNPGETVITKQVFDGFHNPELLQYLRQKRKRFVLTAGVVTSVCVFLTKAAIVFIHDEKSSGSTLLVNIPTWIFVLIIAIGFGLMTFRFVTIAIENTLHVLKKESQ